MAGDIPLALFVAVFRNGFCSKRPLEDVGNKTCLVPLPLHYVENTKSRHSGMCTLTPFSVAREETRERHTHTKVKRETRRQRKPEGLVLEVLTPEEGQSRRVHHRLLLRRKRKGGT